MPLGQRHILKDSTNFLQKKKSTNNKYLLKKLIIIILRNKLTQFLIHNLYFGILTLRCILLGKKKEG